MAQFQLSPCTTSDLDGMIEVYLGAFSPTTMYRMLFPAASCTTAAVRAWLHARFEKSLTEGHAETRLIRATETATGRLVAWSRWGFPVVLAAAERARRDEVKAREESERRELASATGRDGKWPEGANVEACEVYFSAMDGMRAKHWKMDQDYICYMLATDPECQRRGLGSMILDNVIALAEAENRKIYLEATAAGHPLYQKLGWRDIDMITTDLRKWGIDQSDCFWVMTREPQSKGQPS